MSEVKLTEAEWTAAGTDRFGSDKTRWAFVCPACKHIATVQDYVDTGAPEGAIGFSCIGRYQAQVPRDAFLEKGPGPCNYAGGGLFRLNPVTVEMPDGVEHHVFAFAEPAGRLALEKEGGE